MLRQLQALLAIVSFLGFVAAATAQEPPNFDQFDRFAASVEQSIENDRLTEEGFAELRASLAEWRATFEQARGVNAVRIEALQAQIEALGPAPAEGETEAETTAARRAELKQQLTEANAPRVDAEEARARADALIGQIDSRLRERQTLALFELRRTPLDPTLWAGAVASLAGVATTVQREITESLATDAESSSFWQRIALAAVLLIAAIFLVMRGPRLIERWLARIETRAGDHGRIVYGFIVSFVGVVMAMAGVSLINAALITTGILGDVGQQVAIGINAAILAAAMARWLGGRLFPRREAIPTPLTLGESDRTRGRFHSLLLGVMVGLAALIDVTKTTLDFDPDILGVISLPIFLAMAYSLFRLGQLARAGGHTDGDSEANFSDHVERLFGLALQLVAVVGVLAALIGYQSLAWHLLVPAAQSLALITFLIAVHFAIRAGYALVRRLDREQASQALAPVLISFGLVLASTPIFALIWGARDSDLGEVWSRFMTGVRLGETSISPGDFLTFALVFALGFVITRLLQGTMRSSVLPRTRIDKGGQNAIVSGMGYLGVTIAAIAGITAAGIDLSSFAIIIGALGVGIGFGLQNIVNNFVSGIILLIERPIGEGDWVEVGGQMGIVKAISVRSTRIETFDRTDVIVPNGDLISGTVTNWTRGNSIGRVIVPVGVAYGTDTRKVEKILLEIAEAHPIVSVNPPPNVVFQGFGADSLNFEIRAILTDVAYSLSTKSDMNHEIARRFKEEGIEIPFAQRDIWLRNPEVLSQSRQEPRPPTGPVDPSLGGLDVDGD